ncbi:hypothetical protein MKW92_033182 [Papaver armeniacum]|nr:hypothetical protein MKW92_033182 [Papaver armeniacum]
MGSPSLFIRYVLRSDAYKTKVQSRRFSSQGNEAHRLFHGTFMQCDYDHLQLSTKPLTERQFHRNLSRQQAAGMASKEKGCWWPELQQRSAEVDVSILLQYW